MAERDDDIEWTRWARYLAGEGSAEERADVERWVAADPSRREELESLRRMWASAAELPSAARTDAMWDGLARRIGGGGVMAGAAAAAPPAHGKSTADHGFDQAVDAAVASTRRNRTKPTMIPFARRDAGWSRVGVGALAASLLVAVATVGVLAARRFAGAPDGAAGGVAAAPSADSAAREFVTGRGQRATIDLVDGTRVELGFASTLRVRAFDARRRELALEGEAVFHVVHDAARPFLVRAANAVTEDLGTVFGVRAYPGDEAVRVVVVEGKVAVKDTQTTAAGAAARTLLPGQLARLDAAGRLDVSERVDAEAVLAWRSGRVSYRDEPLGAIAADLGRRFDVAVRVSDPAAAARRVTVDMPAAELPAVLDAVTVPLGLRHRREAGGGVVIEQ